MSISAGHDIILGPPVTPNVTLVPPTQGIVVAPIAGPPGPKGDPGDSAELGYVYTTSNPAMLHQIHHGLPFAPGGITCLDSDGGPLLGFTVTHPTTGVTEVAFGVAVTPTIFLS
jgi:hypothetical protein